MWMFFCAGVAVVGAVGLFFALKYRGPPAPLLVHPDDQWMVTRQDIEWFASTSSKILSGLLGERSATPG